MKYEDVQINATYRVTDDPRARACLRGKRVRVISKGVCATVIIEGDATGPWFNVAHDALEPDHPWQFTDASPSLVTVHPIPLGLVVRPNAAPDQIWCVTGIQDDAWGVAFDLERVVGVGAVSFTLTRHRIGGSTLAEWAAALHVDANGVIGLYTASADERRKWRTLPPAPAPARDTNIETATGADLDALGDLVDVRRRPWWGEPDASYRARIRAEVARGFVWRAGIERANTITVEAGPGGVEANTFVWRTEVDKRTRAAAKGFCYKPGPSGDVVRGEHTIPARAYQIARVQGARNVQRADIADFYRRK